MSINTETGKLLRNSSSEEEFPVISFSSPEGENHSVVEQIDRYAIGKGRLCLMNMDCWGRVLFEDVATVSFGFYFLKKSYLIWEHCQLRNIYLSLISYTFK